MPIDPRSLKNIYLDENDFKIYNQEAFKTNALSNTKKIEDIDTKEYIAIYFTGGHGVVFDYYNNEILQKKAYEIYENGGFLTSVCHGLAGLLNIKDREGNYLIKDKKITGFTKTEEILSGKYFLVPFITEDEAKKRGANFVKKRFFSPFSIQDKNIITGQNPMSGRLVVKLLAKNLKK